MGPDLVVVSSPRLDVHLRVRTIPKPLQRQMLVAKLAVERFVGAVLPPLTRSRLRPNDASSRCATYDSPREIGVQVHQQVVHRCVARGGEILRPRARL
jgi:hypothetical protein